MEPGFKAKMSSGLSGVKSSSLRQLSIDTEGISTKQRPAPCQIGLQMGRAEPISGQRPRVGLLIKHPRMPVYVKG